MEDFPTQPFYEVFCFCYEVLQVPIFCWYWYVFVGVFQIKFGESNHSGDVKWCASKCSTVDMREQNTKCVEISRIFNVKAIKCSSTGQASTSNIQIEHNLLSNFKFHALNDHHVTMAVTSTPINYITPL